MQVREINSKEELENFLARVKPQTFLNSWNWGEFQKKLGSPVWRLGVYEGDKLVASTSISKVSARRGTFLIWHHSPVVDPQLGKNFSEILKLLRDASIEIAQKEGCQFFRVSTVLPDTKEFKAEFKKLWFRNAPIHFHSEMSLILNLRKSEDELMNGMRKNTRYEVRKALKDGIEVIKGTLPSDFEKFWELHLKTVERHKFTPYTKDFLRHEFETFLETGDAIIFFGKHNGEIISAAFVVYSKNSGFYHHGASVLRPGSISASELLQWEAIREAKRRGCEEYNFWGVVPDTATKHPWFGLSKFKKGFGGAEVKYLHTQDYVLSARYWITYAIEKVRKIKRGV